MNKAILAFTIATSLLTSAAKAGSSDQIEKDDAIKFVTQQVSNNIYMIQGQGGFTGGNIGISVGQDGVIMIDDSMPPLLDKLQAAVEAISDKPVEFLLNTHVHGDHTGNNQFIAKQGTHIVSHENLRKYMIEHGIPTLSGLQPADPLALPVLTFSSTMNFHLNNEDTLLKHLPHAHTDGDAIVYFKNSNVLHTGDIFFNGLFPYIDLERGGSLEGYIAAQQYIYNLINDDTKLIPGHGPLASKSDLLMSINMLNTVKNRIESLIKQGKLKNEILKLNPLKDLHDKWNWGFITTEKMTIQAYQSLTAKEGHQHHH